MSAYTRLYRSRRFAPQHALPALNPITHAACPAPAAPLLAGAHTDTTFLTVIPCASVPGLEILQPLTGRWVRPEAARNCRPGSDVMLLSGELLQVFGRDRYQAAVHRVVRPAGATQPRVSTPLLVRGVAGVVIRDSMLPPAVTARFEERSMEARRVEGLREKEAAISSSGVDEGKGRLTMTDLWKALQFRGGASSDEECGGGIGHSEEAGGLGGLGGGGDDVVGEDGSSSPPPPPLAEAQTEEEIRALFEPFARGGVTVLSVDPLLVRVHGFASPEECALIIAEGLGTLEESTTWGGADAQAETEGLRSSATTWLADDSIAPLLGTLTERVSGMSGLPSAFMEKWQVRASWDDSRGSEAVAWRGRRVTLDNLLPARFAFVGRLVVG